MVELFDNNFRGSLDIYDPFFMNVFSVHFNNFFETFPISLANYTHIKLLDLRKNGLTCDLLGYLGDFHELSVIYNDLHGEILQSITNLTKLWVLDLSNNKLSGRILPNIDRIQVFVMNGSPKPSLNQ